MTASERLRLRILSGFIVLVGALFIGRLYMLQIVHGAEYREEAEGQYVATVPNIYDRGSIYFKDKDEKLVSAATLESGYIVAIDPKLIVDPEKTYKKISALVHIDHDTFVAQAQKTDDPYEEILDRVPSPEATAIKKLGIPGLKIYRETWRYYPGDERAARLIGFVAFQGEELSGRYGIERFYNDTLSRTEEDLYVNFFAEIFSNLRETLFDRDMTEAGDVVLTIEPNAQSALESELAEVMREWNSDQSGGIVIDPNNGRVIAMAVDPSFDLNHFNEVKDPSYYGNPIVENVYEMGSIVKPLTMAAGIDADVVTAKTTYNDTGTLTLNKRTIANFDGKGRGPGTTMQDVLNQSLNTGVAFVERKLGNEQFADYMLHKFKMGQETGIDLPGEIEGLMTNLSSTRDIEYATASFGQGIAVSPINMTQALAVLANGGYVISPHVVDEIRYESGEVKTIVPNPNERVIKQTTSEEITRMLVEVVDTSLLGGTVKVPEYSIAAKTGTAQIARPRAEGGGYYDDRYLHTFFGYFPAYDPKFLVFMYTYYPKGAKYASHTLTHPFMDLAKFLLNYYNVPPDRDPKGNRLSLEAP